MQGPCLGSQPLGQVQGPPQGLGQGQRGQQLVQGEPQALPLVRVQEQLVLALQQVRGLGPQVQVQELLAQVLVRLVRGQQREQALQQQGQRGLRAPALVPWGPLLQLLVLLAQQELQRVRPLGRLLAQQAPPASNTVPGRTRTDA